MPKTRNRRESGGDRPTATESRRMYLMALTELFRSECWLRSTRQQSVKGGNSLPPKASVFVKEALAECIPYSGLGHARLGLKLVVQ